MSERASGRASERAGGRAQEGLAETKDPAVAETESPGEERHHLERGGVGGKKRGSRERRRGTGGPGGRDEYPGRQCAPPRGARAPRGERRGGRARVRGRQGALGPAPVAARSPAPGPAARGPAKSGQALSPS